MKQISLAKYDKRYKDFENEELVELYQKTFDESILRHLLFNCRDILWKMGKFFFLKRQDDEDLLQEIYYGFFEAAKVYNCHQTGERVVPFRPFAKHIMQRRCIDCLKRQNRQKNMANTESISLQNFVGVSDTVTLQDNLKADEKIFPEIYLSNKTDFYLCDTFIRKILTDLEYQTWTGILWGFSYKEMENALGKSHKSVDNAYQKSKRKIIENLKKHHITYTMFRNYMNYVQFNVQEFKPQKRKNASKDTSLKIS